jgi:hypothetical protein
VGGGDSYDVALRNLLWPYAFAPILLATCVTFGAELTGGSEAVAPRIPHSPLQNLHGRFLFCFNLKPQNSTLNPDYCGLRSAICGLRSPSPLATQAVRPGTGDQGFILFSFNLKPQNSTLNPVYCNLRSAVCEPRSWTRPAVNATTNMRKNSKTIRLTSALRSAIPFATRDSGSPRGDREPRLYFIQL